MTNKTKYLRNTWYVAAIADEVNGNDLFSRVILEDAILIYRNESGKAVAMRDRCPHRFAPLSLGKHDGNTVTCIYHGLCFDDSGTCVNNPHGDGRITERAKVQTFPLEERGGFLWIWMGDPDKADSDLIVDCSKMLNAKPTGHGRAYIYSRSNYQLIADNLMDLTHVDHLHGPLINTAGKLSPQTPLIVEEGDTVGASWRWSAKSIELLKAQIKHPEEDVDNELNVVWHPPGNFLLDLHLHQGEQLVAVEDYHLLTPETATTTHYFFATTRNFLTDDAEYNALHLGGMRNAFVSEDMPVIEAQQIEMGDNELFNLDPLVLSCDAGGVRVRRKLMRMISKEEAE